MLSDTVNPRIYMLALLFGFIPAFLFSIAPLYADPSIEDRVQSYYFGFGAGTSFLQADADSITLTLSHDNDLAYKVFAGYQFDKYWSAEIYAAELGDTGINSRTTGNVVGLAEFQTFGVGGVYQYPLDESWLVFTTAGVGTLNNDFQFIDAQSTNDDFIYAGLGVLWRIGKTWDIRAEYDFYNSNAQFLSFNVVRHFGSKASGRHEKVQAETPLPTATIIVKQKTCDDFQVEFKGIIFAQGSIELSNKSQQALDDLAAQLLELPQDIRFEVRAHSDDVGGELFNYRLSLTRARIVRDYLSTKGIALSRIDAHGYGEWLVKEDNLSSSGREHNRRAELVLLGVEKYIEEAAPCSDLVMPESAAPE